MELNFYKSKNIPLPRKCPTCRHSDRMHFRNSRELFNRKCSKCESDIKSTYNKNREEKIFCEKCYEKEVY
jgi:formylmethanofuran dehydrogenase subunit E